MTNFDWRTDEETGWDAPASGYDGGPQKPERWRRLARIVKRRWRVLATALLTLFVVGVLGVRTLSLRVKAAEAAVREEVTVAHGVLLDAVRHDDAELFLTMLGGDRSWRQQQLSRFEQNAFFDRSALGLEWQQEIASMDEIVLSPDLQQAEITTTLSYEAYHGPDNRDPVALQHYLKYTLQDGQWRLVPYEATFGDGWVTQREDWLGMIFPQRDEAIGARLTTEILPKLERLCPEYFDCPPGLHLQVRFELNDEALHNQTLWINGPMRDDLTVGLPAPSLVGLPADAAAYRALRDGYLRVIVSELFDTLARDLGGASSAVHDARLRRIFADLDLIAWPPVAADAAPLAARDEDILALCTTGPGLSATLLRYDGTLGNWHAVLEDRNLLQMTALDGVAGVLLREQRETERRTTEPQPRITWWSDGREQALFNDQYLGDSVPSSPALITADRSGQNYWIYLGAATDCNGRRCEGTVIHEEPTSWSPNGAHTLFIRELEGSRSPPAGEEVLWLGDREGDNARRLGQGSFPFWIDATTFGYLVGTAVNNQPRAFQYDLVVHRLEGQGSSEISRRPLRLLEALEALNPVEDDVEEMGVAISYVFAHPSRPRTVYIVGTRWSRPVARAVAPQFSIYLFSVDVPTGEVTVRLPQQQRQWTSLPRLSPDGRWLAYVGYDPLNQEGVVAIHDLIAEPSQANVYEQVLTGGARPTSVIDGSRPYDWSRSGQLLILRDGILTVLDPQTWQGEQIVPPTPACAHAAWAE